METTVKTTTWLGAEAIVLENERLRCVCLPKHGGKIASLYQKDKAFELLFQNPRGVFRKAYPGAAFGDYEACGFDDAFPSIDAETVTTESGKKEYFDHGEIWTAAFDVAVEADGVSLRYTSPFLGYRYQKRLALEGDTLTLRYEISNESAFAFPCIWACHCLVNVQPEMKILFPRNVRRVQNVFLSPVLGDAGKRYRFPADYVADGELYDFSGALDARRASMLKIYCVDAVQEGTCGYRYPKQGVEVLFYYDAKQLPYLGYWATAGGYRGDVNCALEPTNGFFDNIQTARANSRCEELKAHSKMEFSLSIRIYPINHSKEGV